MRIKFFVTTCLNLAFITAVSHAADKNPNNNLIIPGKRVGPVTYDMTETTLKMLFPNDTIRWLIDIGEGEQSCATRLYPDSKKEMVIHWRRNDQTVSFANQQECVTAPLRNKIDSIEPSPYWHTQQGIHVGMNLAELEKINRAPIDFEVSDSCFAGSIESWNNGTLEKHKRELGLVLKYADLDPYAKDGIVNSHDLSYKMKKEIIVETLAFYFNQNIE